MVRDSALERVRLLSGVTLYPGMGSVWRCIECFSYCYMWSVHTGCCSQHGQSSAMGMQKSSVETTRVHPANLCFQYSKQEDVPEETFPFKDSTHYSSCSSPTWECGCLSSQGHLASESSWSGREISTGRGWGVSRKEPPH